MNQRLFIAMSSAIPTSQNHCREKILKWLEKQHSLQGQKGLPAHHLLFTELTREGCNTEDADHRH